jgi:secreted trypsin-like serine protease
VRTLLLLATLVGIGGCDSDRLASDEQAIIGGTADPGDPAVIGLAYREVSCGPDVTYIDCTGTLIAPRVVVTAAHCLGFDPPNVHQIFFGSSFSAGGALISVVGGRAHPDYDAASHANDIAALILETDAPPGITPIAMRTTALPDLTGTTVKMVGYGITDIAATMTGEKLSGTARVTGVDASEVSMAPSPAMSCHGDSGGPVLADLGNGEELIGVTTHGDPACAQLGVAQRVDVHASFLQSILDEAAASPARRPFDPAEDLCTTTCASDADCPAETVCFALDAEPRHCVYRGLPGGTFGATCTESASSHPCISVPDGSCRIYMPCDVAPPPSEGCCAVRGRDDGIPACVPIALALLAVRRRRR